MLYAPSTQRESKEQQVQLPWLSGLHHQRAVSRRCANHEVKHTQLGLSSAAFLLFGAKQNTFAHVIDYDVRVG